MKRQGIDLSAAKKEESESKELIRALSGVKIDEAEGEDSACLLMSQKETSLLTHF